MTDLQVKYRPQALEDVLGQDHVVRSLIKFRVDNSWPHSYLFTGPSGCGKTTLGRIIATELGCSGANLVEIDAASNNSVDDIRGLTSGLAYSGFGASPVKVYILDEVHSYSKQAWQALLKSLEEPPEHVYFVLCTTEVDKVPDTVKTRCPTYTLRSVPYDTLADLLEWVAEEEGIELDGKQLTLIAQEAQGSPRRALTMLAKAQGAQDMDELRDVLEGASDNRTVIELCRMLVKGNAQWGKVVRLVRELEDIQPESIRLTIVNYVAKALENTEQEAKAGQLLAILDAFSSPWNPSEKRAPLLLAIGVLILG